MKVMEKQKRSFWATLAFLLVLPFGIWSCGNNAPAEETEGEATEMTEPAAEQPAVDTTAQDTTQQSEHPAGSEHPK